MNTNEISDEETVSAPLTGEDVSSDPTTEEDVELAKKLALVGSAEEHVVQSPPPQALPPLPAQMKRMGGAGRGRGKRKKNSDEEDGGEDVEGPTGTRRLTARQQAMEARLREEREGGPKPAFILLPSAPVLTQEQLLKKEQANARRREIAQKQRRQENEHTLQRIRGMAAGGGKRGRKRGKRMRASAVAIAAAAGAASGEATGDGEAEGEPALGTLHEHHPALRARSLWPRLIQQAEGSRLVYPPGVQPPEPFCLAPRPYPLPRVELAVEWLAESLEVVLRQRLGGHLHLHVQAPDQAWCLSAEGERLGWARPGILQVGSTCQVELRSLSWSKGSQVRVPRGGTLRVLPCLPAAGCSEEQRLVPLPGQEAPALAQG